MRDWTALAAQYPDRFVWDDWGGGRWLPIICGGGKGKTTTNMTVSVPAPSQQEQNLQAKQVELMGLQVEEAKRQSKLLEESFPASQKLLQEQLALTTELVTFQRGQLGKEETAASKEIAALSEQRALAILKGEAPPLSKQQAGFIDEQFAEAERVATTKLRSFADELAATRGLRVTDTPIGEAALREGANVSAQLAGARATAKLDASQTQQVFGESVRQFQESLKQQAFMNRLALTGQANPAAGTLGAANLALAAPTMTGANLLAGYQGERLAGAGRKQTGVYSPGFFDYFSATAQALGAAAGSISKASSARFKRDIAPLDVDEYERARLRVQETPVVRFAYKWEGPEERPHLGVVIETSPEEVSRDGLTLDMPGYVGLTLAALKGVDRRVDRLEARLPVRPRARLPVRSAA